MRSRTCRGCVVTLNPATHAWPSSSSSRVDRIFTAVVLPAPFGPRSPQTVPDSTSRSNPLSPIPALALAYCLRTPCAAIASALLSIDTLLSLLCLFTTGLALVRSSDNVLYVHCTVQCTLCGRIVSRKMRDDGPNGRTYS